MFKTNQQISFISLIVLITVFMVICFLGSSTKNLLAQDEDYYQEVEEQNEVPNDQGFVESEEFPDNDRQNTDPEFMEQQEPGEYDQSEDTTELNEDYY